jgi:hypothetical protein
VQEAGAEVVSMFPGRCQPNRVPADSTCQCCQDWGTRRREQLLDEFGEQISTFPASFSLNLGQHQASQIILRILKPRPVLKMEIFILCRSVTKMWSADGSRNCCWEIRRDASTDTVSRKGARAKALRTLGNFFRLDL